MGRASQRRPRLSPRRRPLEFPVKRVRTFWRPTAGGRGGSARETQPEAPRERRDERAHRARPAPGVLGGVGAGERLADQRPADPAEGLRRHQLAVGIDDRESCQLVAPIEREPGEDLAPEVARPTPLPVKPKPWWTRPRLPEDRQVGRRDVDRPAPGVGHASAAELGEEPEEVVARRPSLRRGRPRAARGAELRAPCGHHPSRTRSARRRWCAGSAAACARRRSAPRPSTRAPRYVRHRLGDHHVARRHRVREPVAVEAGRCAVDGQHAGAAVTRASPSRDTVAEPASQASARTAGRPPPSPAPQPDREPCRVDGRRRPHHRPARNCGALQRVRTSAAVIGRISSGASSASQASIASSTRRLAPRSSRRRASERPGTRRPPPLVAPLADAVHAALGRPARPRARARHRPDRGGSAGRPRASRRSPRCARSARARQGRPRAPPRRMPARALQLPGGPEPEVPAADDDHVRARLAVEWRRRLDRPRLLEPPAVPRVPVALHRVEPNRRYPASSRGGGSSVGRAPGCGPGGRGFESRPPPCSARAHDFRSFGRRSAADHALRAIADTPAEAAVHVTSHHGEVSCAARSTIASSALCEPSRSGASAGGAPSKTTSSS